MVTKKQSQTALVGAIALALFALAGCGGSDSGAMRQSVAGPSATGTPPTPTPTPTPPPTGIPTPPPTGTPTGQVAAIVVSYKLDPRLRGGTYGGELWVTPRTYTVGLVGQSQIIEARADGLDARRQPVSIIARWVPTDPAMVTVTPSQRNEVTIMVHGAGQSAVHVTAEGVTLTLSIKATYQLDVLQVEISQ